MKNAPSPFHPVALAVIAAGLATQTTVRAQDFDQPDQTGWFVRFGPVARFNVKASIKSLTPSGGPGIYDDGFVLPDNGGTASGKTWNWGYNSSSQIVEGQLVLNHLAGVPGIGQQNLSVNNPMLSGEIIAGYHFPEFLIGRKTAHLGFDVGYAYSAFSHGMNFGATGTATRTTDAYGLGGVLLPIAPYAGTAAGPGPLIDLLYSSHAVAISPAATAFQGTLDTTFHNFRIGPLLEIDLTKRLSVAVGAGYSSVFIDSKLKYVETVTFSNPSIPALAPANVALRKGLWRPGAYAELRLNYQISKLIGVFVGGDIQCNKTMSFGDAGHEVKIDPGSTYGAKAGVILRF